MLFQIIITHLLIFVFGVTTAVPQSTNNPGFTEAIFDGATIQKMLNRKNCDGIRIYNTLNGNKVELMAVPISGGADMKGTIFNWTPYTVSLGWNANGIMEDPISKSKAKIRCDSIKNNTTYHFYAVDFGKSGVQKLLDLPNTNALRITPTTLSSGDLSMKMEAVHFNQGTVQSVGSPPSNMIIGDPCPPHCGAAANYVVRP